MSINLKPIPGTEQAETAEAIKTYEAAPVRKNIPANNPLTLLTLYKVNPAHST